MKQRPAIPIVLALAAVATGCATTTRTAKPGMVALHADELLRDGRARVATSTGEQIMVSAHEVVHVRLRDADGVERPVRLTIGELVAGCVDDTLAPGCLAARAIDDPVVTRREVHAHGGKIASAIALGVAGSAIGYCTLACTSQDERDFKKGAVLTGGVVVGTFALLTLAFMSH